MDDALQYLDKFTHSRGNCVQGLGVARSYPMGTGHHRLGTLRRIALRRDESREVLAAARREVRDMRRDPNALESGALVYSA